ncbi:hypothetical protein PV327_005354 [Microctonus hyperodae]|uniref:Gamma tubulin complex component C-terminal domain-containing protein n=1 Tax=Microctonus hyperodae TaxID=165561 RepID=A0AA39G1L7_MICHY|nr:hypothetical protein PV327_005354 [Microctonus hyperodae]
MEYSFAVMPSTEISDSSRHDLQRHTKLINNIYLFGHDEFIPSFITNAWNILDQMPTEHTAREINIIFQNIIKNLMPNDTTAIDYFNFEIPSIHEGKNGWDVINFQYRFPVEFRFFFYDETSNVYMTIFRYLLKLYKAKASSLNFISSKLSNRQAPEEFEMLITNLHTIFTVLIGYLRSVFDSQYALLELSMQNARGYGDMQKAHFSFLHNIVSLSFLPINYNTNHTGPECYFILELLDYYDNFVLKLKWDFSNDLDSSRAVMKICCDRFNKIKNLAIATMQSVKSNGFNSKYLRILILSFEFQIWNNAPDEIANLDKFFENLQI